MITSEIKFSQMEDRMDAGYYRPEYLNVSKKISSLPNLKTIGEIASVITNGATPLGPLYAESGIKFFLEQMGRELTGAAIPAISLEDIKQVLIYLPSIEIQNEISNLIEASNRLCLESRSLIEQAKGEVEDMIQKGIP